MISPMAKAWLFVAVIALLATVMVAMRAFAEDPQPVDSDEQFIQECVYIIRARHQEILNPNERCGQFLAEAKKLENGELP